MVDGGHGRYLVCLAAPARAQKNHPLSRDLRRVGPLPFLVLPDVAAAPS
jgi:hypothetical protein